MLKTKILKKKSLKTDKLLKNLHSLSKNNVQVGHFKEGHLTKKHTNSNLTYPELLQGWASGIFQKGVIKNPLEAFETLVLRNKALFKNPKIKRTYKKWFNNLLDDRSSKMFLEEIGQILRDDYKELFGKAGYKMPVVGSNYTPLEDTGELKSATAYKTSYDNNVNEAGIR